MTDEEKIAEVELTEEQKNKLIDEVEFFLNQPSSADRIRYQFLGWPASRFLHPKEKPRTENGA